MHDRRHIERIGTMEKEEASVYISIETSIFQAKIKRSVTFFQLPFSARYVMNNA